MQSYAELYQIYSRASKERDALARGNGTVDQIADAAKRAVRARLEMDAIARVHFRKISSVEYVRAVAEGGHV